MPNLIQTVTNERDNRSKSSQEEFKKLSCAAYKALNEKSINQKTVLEAIRKDVHEIELLNTTIRRSSVKEHAALTSNKLKFLLQGSEVFVKKHWQEIVSATLSDELVQPWGNSSLKNFAQTALLEILSIARDDCKINKIPDLLKEKIYQDNDSPNIQSLSSKGDQPFEKYAGSRWLAAHGDKEDKRLRLSIPGLGYWFGGSRFLPEYNDKALANEDCSSAVAKWVEAREPFSTVNILNIKDPNQKTLYDLAAKEVLEPATEPFPGAIFCKKGHTGMVVEYQSGDDKIKVISYTRMMPGFEGLIEQSYDLHTVDNQHQTKVDNTQFPNKLVQDYYGLDNHPSASVYKFSETHFYQPINSISDMVSSC